MSYKVFIIEDAEEDLFEIYSYVATYDSIGNAEGLINKLEETCYSLETFANRGHVPPELEQIGILDYKEVHYKPYRIIYQIRDSNVYVHCILDGRRDLQQLLQERLLR